MAAVTAQNAIVLRPKQTPAQVALEKKQADARRRAEIKAQANKTATLAVQSGYVDQRFEESKRQLQQNNALAKTAVGKAGTDWGLIPLGAKVIGTGAAIIASGGAVAGALGATAASSAVAGAAALNTGISAAQKAAKAAKAAAKGDVVGLAAAGALPTAAKVGDMAGIKVPTVKVKVPSPNELAKEAAAKAKQTASTVAKAAAAKAKQTATTAVKKATTTAKATVAKATTGVKTSVQAAAPKVAVPKAAPALLSSSIITAVGKLSASQKAKLDSAASAKIQGATALLANAAAKTAAKPAPKPAAAPAPKPPASKGATAPPPKAAAAPAPKAAAPAAAPKPAAPPATTAVMGPKVGAVQEGIFITKNGIVEKNRRWAPVAA